MISSFVSQSVNLLSLLTFRPFPLHFSYWSPLTVQIRFDNEDIALSEAQQSNTFISLWASPYIWLQNSISLIKLTESSCRHVFSSAALSASADPCSSMAACPWAAFTLERNLRWWMGASGGDKCFIGVYINTQRRLSPPQAEMDLISPSVSLSAYWCRPACVFNCSQAGEFHAVTGQDGRKRRTVVREVVKIGEEAW